MRSSKSRKKKARGLLFAIIFFIAIIVLGLLFFNAWLSEGKKPYDKDNTNTISVHFEMGTSTTNISEILEREGVIGNAKKFKVIAKKNGYDGKFQAGDYVLSPSMSADEIMQAICYGVYESNRFTIIEGLTTEETAAALVSQGILDEKAVFLTECAMGQFDNACIDKITKYYSGPSELRLEGMLMPNTYDINKVTDAHEAIKIMLDQFDKVFDDSCYARCEELGITPYEALIIASLIEREAGCEADRANIASVIYNRLDLGMLLQIDASVIYAIGGSDGSGVVTYDDLEVDSPYNTYKNAGLPPTPICSPGAASIQAALYPADTNYCYYVLSDKLDGSHVFTNSGDEFNKLKAAYKKALKDN